MRGKLSAALTPASAAKTWASVAFRTWPQVHLRTRLQAPQLKSICQTPAVHNLLWLNRNFHLRRGDLRWRAYRLDNMMSIHSESADGSFLLLIKFFTESVNSARLVCRTVGMVYSRLAASRLLAPE